MGPSSIDAEIRSLGPEAGGDLHLLQLFMLFIEHQLGTRRDFELTEAVLGLLLKVSQQETLHIALLDLQVYWFLLPVTCYQGEGYYCSWSIIYYFVFQY